MNNELPSVSRTRARQYERALEDLLQAVRDGNHAALEPCCYQCGADPEQMDGLAERWEGSMNRSTPLERKTPLKRGPWIRPTQKPPDGATRPKGPPTGLKRRTPLGHCTEAQKARVRDLACIVCGLHAGECHPAHLIDRGRTSREAADDVRAVVPLCEFHHRAYDCEQLDLIPHLEPRWRDSLAWAVEAVGFFRALRRITGRRWAPMESDAA